MITTGARPKGFGAGAVVLKAGRAVGDGATAATARDATGRSVGGLGGAGSSPNGLDGAVTCEPDGPPNGDRPGGTNAAATGFSRPLGADGGARDDPNAEVGTGCGAGEGARVGGKEEIGVGVGKADFGNAEAGPNGLLVVGAKGEGAGLGCKKDGCDVGAVDEGREGNGVAAVKRGGMVATDRGEVGIAATGLATWTRPSITSG